MDASAADDRMLWDWMEQAWRATPGGRKLRAEITGGKVEDLDARMAPFFDSFDRWLGHLTNDGVVLLARAFERKLFALDREELAHAAGLGDDGFLDARAFTVVMGEAFFERVLREGPYAGVGTEKAYGTLTRHYERRFRTRYPRFNVCVATGSNPDGWPRLRADHARDARVTAALEHLTRELRLGHGEPRLTPGEVLHLTFPNLAPSDLALVFRRLAAVCDAVT